MTGSIAGEAVLELPRLAETGEEEDLLEFLAADLDPVPADPDFRERLRAELWGLVADGSVQRPKDS
jgi:hypothetical protein